MALGHCFRARSTLAPSLDRYTCHCLISSHMFRRPLQSGAAHSPFNWGVLLVGYFHLGITVLVAGSHRFCAKLWSHRSGGWERVVTPLLTARLVCHGMKLVLLQSPIRFSFLRSTGTIGSTDAGNNIETYIRLDANLLLGYGHVFKWGADTLVTTCSPVSSLHRIAVLMKRDATAGE